MDKVIHKASTRGSANYDWLDTHHTFSFSNYFNSERMNFGLLRVLNDDIVTGGKGFGKHPHNNMEIVSIPLKGDLEHKDSIGNTSLIRKNDIQIMSAGTGVTHSEYNYYNDRPVNFLQIWVFPKVKNIEPRYEQKQFKPEERINKLQTVVAPDNDNALWINQDSWFTLSNLKKGFETNYSLKKAKNGIYVFVINGKVTVAGEELGKRDGGGFWNITDTSITALEDSELLIIEVPMS